MISEEACPYATTQLATLKAAGKDFDYYNIANLDGASIICRAR